MIEFSNDQKLFQLSDEIKNLINCSIDTALKFESFNHNYEISVVITDNAGIKKMNNQYRSIDRETDVLSFPMIEFSKYNLNGLTYEISGDEINPETGNVMLGDIVISIEKATQQALEYGHSFEREMAFLTVHSTLHLLGYDHMLSDEESVMREKEEKILASINLSR